MTLDPPVLLTYSPIQTDTNFCLVGLFIQRAQLCWDRVAVLYAIRRPPQATTPESERAVKQARRPRRRITATAKTLFGYSSWQGRLSLPGESGPLLREPTTTQDV